MPDKVKLNGFPVMVDPSKTTIQQARHSVRNLPSDVSILSGIAYFSDNPAIMKKITLQFSSLDDLWDFVLDSKLEFIEINIRKKLLVCQCSEKDVELAINRFNATRLGN